MYLNNFDNRKLTLSPKKKKRKHSIDNSASNQNSYSGINPSSSNLNKTESDNSSNLNKRINIIDRVLDLSKYDKNTSLYTLSRDWINATTETNKSLTNKKSSFLNDDEKKVDHDNSYNITSLPDPLIIENKTTIEQLNENIKMNIRSKEANDVELIKSLNVDDFMQTHALLKLHVNRWKEARKEWNNYYKETNKTYKNSYDILKSIFEEFV